MASSMVELYVLFWVFIRTTSFLVVSPFFQIRRVPAFVKVGTGLILALLLLPAVSMENMVVPVTTAGLVLVVIQETLVGLILGFAATLVFAAIRLAGELIDLHIGFSMASLFDPQSGMSTTLLGQFLYILAVLLFLTLDGHHSLLMALAKSLELVPLTGAVFQGTLAGQMAGLFSEMFVLGFKIAAPLIAVMVISDLSLSLVSRTVPQLNVFIIGFPLKAGLGMLTLIFIMPLLAVVVAGIIGQMEKDLMFVIRSLT